MTKDHIQSLISNYLAKQAEEGPAHEAAEAPDAEMLEHAMGAGAGGGGEEQPQGAGPGGVDVEQLLAQLSPEELQALIAQLSQGEQPGAGAPGMGAPGMGAPDMGAPDEGGEDVAGLSQNIESHLAQNPEAQVPGAPPEKMAALNFVKSAHYIEGFIKQALDYGLDTNQAVNMYDSALTTTVDALKKEAYSQKNLTAPKGLMHKARVGFNRGKSRAINLASRTGDKIKEHAEKGLKNIKEHGEKGYQKIKDNPKTSAGVGAAALGAGGYAAYKASDKEKKAAYFEGVFKQAMAYGFSEAEAYEVVKEAARFQPAKVRRPGVKVPIDKTSPPAGPAVRRPSKVNRPETAPSKMDNLKAFGSKHKDKAIGAAAGLAVGGAVGYASNSSDKEKKAAYLEGVFKQAMAYGFSEQEAVQFAQQAEANL